MNRIVIALALFFVGVLLWFLRPQVRDVDGSMATGQETAAAANSGQRRGALVDEVVFVHDRDMGQIASLIESGSRHVFAQGVASTTLFQRLRNSRRAAYDFSYGSSVELTLNPVGPSFANGELNPFHVPAFAKH